MFFFSSKCEKKKKKKKSNIFSLIFYGQANPTSFHGARKKNPLFLNSYFFSTRTKNFNIFMEFFFFKNVEKKKKKIQNVS